MGREEGTSDCPDEGAAAGAVPTESSARDGVTTVDAKALDLLQAAGGAGKGKGDYSKANTVAGLRSLPVVTGALSTPLEANADSIKTQAAKARGIQHSETMAESTHVCDRVHVQEQEQKHSVEAAVSAVIAAAAVATAEQEQEALPKMDEEGGRASSVLSALLSAVLRQLLPWVLPSALKGASATDVEVSISKKQLTLSGVSLQPQELTALTGAPLHLLHCSIGEVQLQMGRQGKAGALASAPCGTVAASTVDAKISEDKVLEGGAPSPSKTAAAADGRAKAVGMEEFPSLVLSVKDVIVVLTPASPKEWSRQQLLELALQRRRSLLYSLDSELQQQQPHRRGDFFPYVSNLISNWIDRNIHWATFDLTNVHLRVEFLVPPCNSSSSTPSGPFAFGVHLEELRMRTLPVEESKGSCSCAAHEVQQQPKDKETAAASPLQTTEATAEPLLSSSISGNCSCNSQGSVCSEFGIKGCSMYTQNELLLLSPHTRTVTENIERLCAVHAEQQQRERHQRSQQAEEDWLQPGYNAVQPNCHVPATVGSKQQHSSTTTSRCSRSLLAPVSMHGFLRKNAMIGHPKGNGDRRSSSVALQQGGSRSQSASAVVYVHEAMPSAGPAYVASVESDCLEVTISPDAIGGLRWLAANIEVHRKAVDAAEGILSLVRPFVPSCTVRGNPRIWWRFAIRAICRLQRSRHRKVTKNGINSATGTQFDASGDGMTVEEVLKVRLCIEKAATYRRLRLLQLQGKLTQQQHDQLLHLRDSIPLPQLLQSHAASGQDFLDQQAKTSGVETAKTWARWFPLWKRSPPQQGFATAAKTPETMKFDAAAGAEAGSRLSRPALPPLSLQGLLAQHRTERPVHQDSAQQILQNGEQELREQCEQEEAYPGGDTCFNASDDFFDACSQPSTARLNSSSLKLRVGPRESPAPSLMPASSKETQQRMQAHNDKASEEPLPASSEVAALRGTGEATSQEDSGTVSVPPAALAPEATHGNKSYTLENGEDFPEGDDVFYDCLDLQTPRSITPASHGGGSPGAASTISRSSPNALQDLVMAPVTSKHAAHTISVSVFLRSASVAYCVDGLKASQAVSQQEQRGSFRKHKQGRKQAVDNIILCCVGVVRLSYTVGTEMFEGRFSVDRLGISFNKRGPHPEQRLVFMDPKTKDAPLLCLHASQRPFSAPFAPLVDDRKGSSQDPEPATGVRDVRAGIGTDKPCTLLSLTVRRVVCILEPHVLQEATVLKKEFSSAATAGELVVIEASQQCSLLRLTGCTGPGCKRSADVHAGRIGTEMRAGSTALHRRLLRLSPSRQQQLRDGASLRYAVSVEAPTVIVPASEGRAILCHLGELRVCSGHLEQTRLFCTQEAEANASPGFIFADTIFQQKYSHILKAQHSPEPSPEVAGVVCAGAHGAAARTRPLRHVSLRTHHGLLLRDSGVLLHSDLEQLKRELTLPHSSGCREPMGSSGSCYRGGNAADRRRMRRVPQQKERITLPHSSGCPEPMGSSGSCYRGGNGADRRRMRRVPQQKEGACNASSGGVGTLGEGNKIHSALGTARLPTSWDIGDAAKPIIFPSEVVAVVEVAHVDMLPLEVVMMPLKVPSCLEKTQPTRPAHREFRATAVDLHPCRTSGGEGAQQTSGQQEVGSIPQQQQRQPQEQQQQNAHGVQDQRLCEVQISVNGKCNEVRASLSRHSCAAMLSAFKSLKTALRGKELTGLTSGFQSFGSAVRGPTTFAERASIPNEVCNGRKARGEDEICSSIPICIDASVEWEKLSIYLHHLEESTDGQEEMDKRNKSFCRGVEKPANAEDSVQMQATGVSAHFNSRDCRTTYRLESKQLLLEQPSLPAESINSKRESSSDCKSSSNPYEGRSQRDKSIGRVQEFEAEAEATLTTRKRTVFPHEADASSAQHEFEAELEATLTTRKRTVFPHEADACSAQHVREATAEPSVLGANDDPVLREVFVGFQAVDFLWSTRGSDIPLATASVSAASVRLYLCRYSTKINGSVKDLTLHFVVPSVGSAGASTPSSGCRWGHVRQFQSTQVPWDVPHQSCAYRAHMQNRFTKRELLQSTEIIGLLPGRSYVLSLSLESVHPLSPQFSGISSNLKVDVGACRVVYVHPKFWRLFDWIIDDFIGTLTSSQSSAVSPPQETKLGNGPASQEAPPKRIERSPSLEDLAVRTVLQSTAAGEMPAFPCTAEGNERKFMADGMGSRFAEKQLFLVPNEGLRRIFLLADAGRSILGLSPLFQERQQGPGGSTGGDSKLHRLLLPEELPFSVIHYEVQITSPCLFLPAACRPKSQLISWPPDGGLNGDHLIGGGCWGATIPATGGGAATCIKCRDYPATLESSTRASGREVVCFLDSFTVSNSWNLSRGHGIVESINVTFKGAKAFGKIDDFSQGFSKVRSKAAVEPAGLTCGDGFQAPYLKGTCRRCARRAPCSARSSRRESGLGLRKCPPAATPGDSEEAVTPSYPGRYLLGSVDLVIRMFRPVLLRSSSRWLRVEAGLLPLTLDVQTLGLVFDIVENNFTANDPDIAAGNSETPPRARSPARSSQGRPGVHARRGTGPSTSKSDGRFSISPPAPQGSFGTAACNVQESLSDLVQKLLGNQILQGLLEPQVDFIELLEEWGQETLLLELVIEGLHLSVCEEPLKDQALLLRKQCGVLRRCIRALECRRGLWQDDGKSSQFSPQEGGRQGLSSKRLRDACIPQQTPFLLIHASRLRAQLRSLRLQTEQAERVGLVLSNATIAPPWTSFVKVGKEHQLLDKGRTPSLASAPVVGTFIEMRVGSSTIFSPDLAPPFSVVFTDSASPLSLLQQELEPLAESVRQAKDDAVAAAIAIAKTNELLCDQGGLASSSGASVGEQVKHLNAQLSGNLQQPLFQEEHLLVAPFAAPWIEPLQLQNQTQGSSTDDHGLISGATVAAGFAGVAEGGRYPSLRSSSFTLPGGSVSASPFEIPSCSRDYEVVFRRSVQPQQEQRRAQHGVPEQLLAPEPSELTVIYKSASAVPVIPLSDQCALTASKKHEVVHDEKIQILRQMLEQRQHRRKQQRITVSSKGPRCVLTLALLSRIGAFLSRNEAANRDACRRTNASSDVALDVMAHRESWQGTKWINCVAPACSLSNHSCGERRPCIRSNSRGSYQRDLNQDQAAYLPQDEVTGDSSSKEGSSSDLAGSGGSSSVGRDASQEAILGSGIFSAETEITKFGSRELPLCRSSFDTAKRFAVGLSSRRSSETLLLPYAEGAPSDEHSNDCVCEISNKQLPSKTAGSRHRLFLCGARSCKETGAAAAPRRQESPPLQLNSMEVSVRLSGASLLLPVDQESCESASVLLRGSVSVSRRADDVRDPLSPQSTSKDAELAASAYGHIQGSETKGNRKPFWVCGMSSASSVEEQGAPEVIRQQQEAFGQGRTELFDTLPDRFFPGVRGVDVLLQQATATCLRNSTPLHQPNASAADASEDRTDVDLRKSRRLRWTSRTGKRPCGPAKASAPPNQEEAGGNFPVPSDLRSVVGEGEVDGQLRYMPSATASCQHIAAARAFPPNTPVKDPGSVCPNGRVCGAAARVGKNLAVTNSEARDAELHSNARIIGNGLRARISHVLIPPAARCHQHESLPSHSISASAQASIGGNSGSSCDGQHHENVGRSHESCCCCLGSEAGSSDAAAGEGVFGLVCDCCCHHPQEYTALQVSPCELELSYLDCLLIYRCAAEQIMQLEQQKQRQQTQRAVVQRLLHRSAILERQLSMKQLLLRKQFKENDDQTPDSRPPAVLSFSSAISPETQQGILRRSRCPSAAAASAAERKHQFTAAYPRQRHMSAHLPLLRVTLLNCHLDCFQAPLLQLLVQNCRLSQASSLLPPHATDAPRLCLKEQPQKPQVSSEQPQKPQVSSVSLLNASLRLWAFNPIAVAFEPVVESLPLSLIVREAPYSLMRFAYSSCCDNDYLALSVAQRAFRSRRLQQKISGPSSSHSCTRGSAVGTFLERASSSPAPTLCQQMSSSSNLNGSSTSSNGKDLANSAASVPFRFLEGAAVRQDCGVENQQQPGSSNRKLTTVLSLEKLKEELPLRGHASGEASMSNTPLKGGGGPVLHSEIKGGADVHTSVEWASTMDALSSSKRYVGIWVSSTEGGSIEANLSPLLLQSVLGSLCQWHCDFTHHMQQQRQQRPQNARGSPSLCEKRSQLSQACHQVLSPQHQQTLLQHQEQQPEAPNYVKGQSTVGQQEQHEGATEVPYGRKQNIFANTMFLRRRPSRSVDASPICRPPVPEDAYRERRHSLCGSLPEVNTDRSLGIQPLQLEQRPFGETAGLKRGKLFFPYHVVNQTGLHLGLQLLPAPPAVSAPDSESPSGSKGPRAAAALPSTLRLCRLHNRNAGALEQDGSSSDSNSSTSEAEAGRALAGVPIHWAFGPTLQNKPCESPRLTSAATSASVEGTLAFPSSPSFSREEKSVHFGAWGDSSSWDWLQPSEKRALPQMRVPIGTASTAHVALQLARQPIRATAAEQPQLENTLHKTPLLTDEQSIDERDAHLDASCRQWRLNMPVPLDRVGVYIQPLADVSVTLI
ncbi:hypothetical protein, conserved [Eimeria praecox]|uniref:Vacuolar protein sorting-associated protein 13 DH-like domain-containing protein n=1 Tax=Eimeria praecox TaxID=51316 RepID=U6H6P7_9EIME|nr:hypothetical protein, conserved [Eimeria praecox]